MAKQQILAYDLNVEHRSCVI